MKVASVCLIGFVALLHFWFLILEMFLWQKPLGLKTFRNTPEIAKTTAVLAANQGLYNGFLAVGLSCSFCLAEATAQTFQVYFLICIIIAGIYGAWTVHRKILLIQAVPAAIALILLLI